MLCSGDILMYARYGYVSSSNVPRLIFVFSISVLPLDIQFITRRTNEVFQHLSEPFYCFNVFLFTCMVYLFIQSVLEFSQFATDLCLCLLLVCCYSEFILMSLFSFGSVLTVFRVWGDQVTPKVTLKELLSIPTLHFLLI